MATLEQLRSQSFLGRAMPRLLAGQQAERRFYFTRRFKEWFDQEMPLIAPTFWGGDVPTKEQINGIIKSFVAGEDLYLPEQLHIVDPAAFGIWELKTGDIRIFGWFPEYDTFIASTAGDATELHQGMKWSYYCKCMWVVSERKLLDLNEPKFRAGGRRHDVFGS